MRIRNSQQGIIFQFYSHQLVKQDNYLGQKPCNDTIIQKTKQEEMDETKHALLVSLDDVCTICGIFNPVWIRHFCQISADFCVALALPKSNVFPRRTIPIQVTKCSLEREKQDLDHKVQHFFA